MQHQHVLLTRRFRRDRLNQNAKENANSHKPHTARQLNPIPARQGNPPSPEILF
jgi:hypothetical protein